MRTVWVVESGCKYEGGVTRAVFKHRTQARVLKAKIQREEYFFHDCDYCRIRKFKIGEVKRFG